MENSCVIMILVLILLVIYWSIKIGLKVREEIKLENENEALVNDIKYFNDRVKNILLTFNVEDTTWGYYQIHFFEDYIKNALDIPLLESTRDINERYNNHIFILNEKYEKFKNELISEVLPEIDYNLENWPKLLINFPSFFVAESVGGVKDSLYCHSYNMEFDTSNLTFSGIVFTNVNSNGSLRYFNPKNWGIRVMTEYEFNKIFLPNILNDCDFKDVRELKNYSNYLKKEFKIFKEKYE